MGILRYVEVIASYGLRATGYGLRVDRTLGMGHRVRHCSMEDAEGV